MRRRVAGACVLALAAAGTVMAGAAPAAKKPAAKAAAQPAGGAAATVARLKKDEAAVKSGRLSMLVTQREADLPEDAKTTNVRDIAVKSPVKSQTREYLVYSGPNWKRDQTVMDNQGNVSLHQILGMNATVGRVLQETGHAEKEVRAGSVGIQVDQNSSDAFLLNHFTDVLEGVEWTSVKPVGAQQVLSGKRGGESITLTVRTTPRVAADRLVVSEQVRTPQGPVIRGQQMTATYEVSPAGLAPKTLEHVVYILGPVHRAVVTTYKVEGAQLNQAVRPDELAVTFPAGTRVVDRRFEPAVRYTATEKEPTQAELKELAARQVASGAKVGRPAPEIELKKLGGGSAKLSDYRGKVVLLTWFASWCGPCRAEAPVMEKNIWQKYKGQGLAVFGVNAAEREDPEKMARQFATEGGITYPVLMDTEQEASDSYQVEVFPTIAVIDKKGVLRYLETGFDEESVTTQIRALLEEK